MKIITTSNQMQIRTNGLKTVFAGIVFTIFGLDLVYSMLGQDNSFYPIVFGSLFAIIGIALLFFSKTTTIVLEKEGTTSITSKYTIGMSQAKRETIPTIDIAAVMLSTKFQQNRNSDGSTTPSTSSSLSLLLKNNDVIKIEESSGGMSISGFNISNILSAIGKAPLSKEAKQIAEFLGVPVKSPSEGLI